MRLSLINDLPMVRVTIAYQGKSIEVENVLLDTGSATTLLSADIVSATEKLPTIMDLSYAFPARWESDK